jgi:hypothetical protein
LLGGIDRLLDPKSKWTKSKWNNLWDESTEDGRMNDMLRVYTDVSVVTIIAFSLLSKARDEGTTLANSGRAIFFLKTIP